MTSREVPIPTSISAQAQAALAMKSIGTAYPPLDDHDAWRAMVAATEETLLALLTAANADVKVDVEERSVDGVHTYVLTPVDTAAGERRVFLDVHGGGLILGGGACARAMSTGTVARVGMPTWSVDYRMPPDHPYPAPLDDCVTVYRALLQDHAPEEIIVGGASAGGNLAAALILRARDEGLPLPAAAVLLTPELDLTESGDTFQTNLGIDTVLTRSLMPANVLYANGHDLAHPYLSPLFGDFTKGFPPTFLQTGTRDLFLSNTVRMHRALLAAGVPAELHVFEAMPHGGFGGAPEDADLARAVRSFVNDHWPH